MAKLWSLYCPRCNVTASYFKRLRLCPKTIQVGFGWRRCGAKLTPVIKKKPTPQQLQISVQRRIDGCIYNMIRIATRLRNLQKELVSLQKRSIPKPPPVGRTRAIELDDQ